MFPPNLQRNESKGQERGQRGNYFSFQHVVEERVIYTRCASGAGGDTRCGMKIFPGAGRFEAESQKRKAAAAPEEVTALHSKLDVKRLAGELLDAAGNEDGLGCAVRRAGGIRISSRILL